MESVANIFSYYILLFRVIMLQYISSWFNNLTNHFTNYFINNKFDLTVNAIVFYLYNFCLYKLSV